MNLEESYNGLLEIPTSQQFQIKSLYHLSHRGFVPIAITNFSQNQLSCFGDATHGEEEWTGKMQLRRLFVISARRRNTGSYCPFLHNFIHIFENNIVTEII
jgi:hypothetical protein